MVPRFGRQVIGGAETHVRQLALRATPPGWSVEIATTCARDHQTWSNDHPAGTALEDGMPVHRFAVSPRSAARYESLHTAIIEGRATYLDEIEWLSQSVWSEDLQRWLETSDHDLAVFSPYLFGTTVWGAQVDPDRAAMMPCLHDEPYARIEVVRRSIAAVRGCLFNSTGEERLARSICDVRDGGVVGLGFDAPSAPPPPGFARKHGLDDGYVIYAGRLEEGKRVHVAVEYAVRYAHERPDAPRLVLIGSGDYHPPPAARGIVTRLGYLSEEEKRRAFAEALALVNPSELESLSIVLMESWLEGTPALVAAGSEVMRDHCEQSGGGLAFGSYEQYRDSVDLLLADPGQARAMGAQGREYVLDVYGWPSVSRRFNELVGRLAA